MASRIQGAPRVPGYYVWEPEGTPVEVHLRLDLVERLAREVLRGFGALPKRGAEVGGILVGSVEPGAPAIVRIEALEPVQCDYKRGPSYLFTADDGAAFEEAWTRLQPAAPGSVYAVGYYRSHTREGMSLGPEDVELMEEYFAEPEHVALLVKPFASKVSAAGFFVRQGSLFPSQTPLEFPLGRRELTGEDPPPRRPLEDRRAGMRAEAAPAPQAEPPPDWDAAATAAPRSSRNRVRAGWVWIPLSFIFLLLGVILGIQSALTMAPKPPAVKPADFGLALAVSRMGENLSVTWTRDAPVIRAASKGQLEIEDGGFSKTVDLDAANLHSGSLVYRNSSDRVRFRLVVTLGPRLTLAETADWRQ
jgi:hypothetical protein